VAPGDRGPGQRGRVAATRVPGLLLALGLAGLAHACGGDDTPAEPAGEDIPFEGEAWPKVPRPIVVPAGGMGLVTDSLADTVSAIDLGTGDLIATRPVGRNPVDIDGPHHIVVDQAGGSAFIALSYPVVGGAGPHAGHGASQALGWVQRLSLEDLTVTGQVRVQTNPGDLVLSQDGKRLVVSHFDLAKSTAPGITLEAARASLGVIDPATIALTGSGEPRFIEACVAPHGISLSRPDGRFAFVACYAEDALAVVDLDAPDGAVQRIPLGAGVVFGSVAYGPYAATLSPDGTRVAVASLVSKDVRFFDVETGAFEERDPVVLRGSAFFPAWSEDGAVLWVPMQSPDGIVRIDVDEGTQEERAFTNDDGCELPHEAERLPDGRIALVCEGDHVAPGTVLQLDPDSLETLTTTTVGVFPDAIERVAPAGSQ
jgi:DNA-binding beta-propeller fold protein YncE